MRIYLKVELPDELAGEFLQAIRDFDTKIDPRHEDIIRIEMLGESSWPVGKMESIFREIRPGFRYTYVKKATEDQP